MGEFPEKNFLVRVSQGYCLWEFWKLVCKNIKISVKTNTLPFIWEWHSRKVEPVPAGQRRPDVQTSLPLWALYKSFLGRFELYEIANGDEEWGEGLVADLERWGQARSGLTWAYSLSSPLPQFTPYYASPSFIPAFRFTLLLPLGSTHFFIGPPGDIGKILMFGTFHRTFENSIKLKFLGFH
jgi:hypothetical protein